MRKSLTVGMAVHADYDGLYSTLQALRLYHRRYLDELIVIDNTVKGAVTDHGTERELNKDLCQKMHRDQPGMACRYIHTKMTGTAQPRNLVFQESSSEYTMCVDAHVFLHEGALAAFHEYIDAFPDNNDLIQGPLYYDDTDSVLSTHMEPQWGTDSMFGVWHDTRQTDKWLEIPAQGLGLFAMRTAAWPTFNEHFREFGGEEGYIHDKVRQRGGRCVCVRGLGWNHRFEHVRGKAYRNTQFQMMANYIVGRAEFGYRWDDVLNHFKYHRQMGQDDIDEAIAYAKGIYPQLGDPANGKDFVMYSGVKRGLISVTQGKEFVDFANVASYDRNNTILPVIQNDHFESTDAKVETVDSKPATPVYDKLVADLKDAGVIIPPREITMIVEPTPSLSVPRRAEVIPLPISRPQKSLVMPAHPISVSAQPQRPAKVTAICMTYGYGGTAQQRLIEESVQSFLKQTYPHKEMLLINDTPGSRLRCGAAGVHVINLPKRCLTLGEKLNIGLSMAEEYVAIWDDDDISLPGRLEQGVNALQNHTHVFMYNSQRYWFWPVGTHGEDTHMGIVNPGSFGYGLMTAVFRRDMAVSNALVQPLTGDYDAHFMVKAQNLGLTILTPNLTPDRWQYIYRWGVSKHHASGGVPNVVYAQAGDFPIVTGDHTLNPRWLQPYDKFVLQALVNKPQREGVRHVEEFVGVPGTDS